MKNDLFPVSRVVLEVSCPICEAEEGAECSLTPHERGIAARTGLLLVHVERLNDSARRLHSRLEDE